MQYSRREMAKIALASVPLAKALAAKRSIRNSTASRSAPSRYSFNRIASPDPEAIIRAYVEIGLGEAELMSNHCEALAGAPAMPVFGRSGGGAARAAGRPSAAHSGTDRRDASGAAEARRLAQRHQRGTWRAVTKKFNDAGVDVALLCYNMQDSMTDGDIELGSRWPKGWESRRITTSTTLTMAKRIAPIADQHKLLVGYHGHDATNDPNQTATLESYDTLMAYGKYNGINLDIGHFTAAGYDAVAFIKQHHAKITNLHLKDRKKDHGPNVAVWGTGDTPMKEVLQLLKKEKYAIPGQPRAGVPDSRGFGHRRGSEEVFRLRQELSGVVRQSRVNIYRGDRKWHYRGGTFSLAACWPALSRRRDSAARHR